jgi:tetratricopeptide (TPR) repeat protein
LFPIEPFVWYFADVRYDIRRGTYDLTIRREGSDRAIVDLEGQPNATSTPESSVDKFSFVGSVFEDDSDVIFYVDDVVIGTDEKVILAPFVAPGRRKLFIDRWREAKELMMKSPGCPPVLSLADFALSGAEGDFEGQQVVREWRSGCALLERDPVAAAQLFAKEAAEHPGAAIFAISELLALARARDDEAVTRRWRELEPILRNDVRYGMIAALADLDRAEQWFRENAREEELFFVLLWKGEFARAASLAEKEKWHEHAGDALFLAGLYRRAQLAYEQALQEDPNAWWAAAKLSDVHHALGDAANERLYRQRLFGALKE